MISIFTHHNCKCLYCDLLQSKLHMLRKDKSFFFLKTQIELLKMKNTISEIKIILDDSVQHNTLNWLQKIKMTLVGNW